MTLLTAGITKEVIREAMPPYSLDADLLARAVTVLPPPPPDASASWRQARLRRVVREISVLVPADAAQAKLATQIVVLLETADDTLDRANMPGLTTEQVCRVRRAAADLTRTSATLERTLSRRQELPAAFFGTVLGDEVDIAALDAVWVKAARADRRAGFGGVTAVGVADAGVAEAGVAATGLAAGGVAATGGAAVGVATVRVAYAPRPAAPEIAGCEAATPEAVAPEPAALGPSAAEPAASEPAASELDAPGSGTPAVAAGIAPGGVSSVRLPASEIAASGRIPVGLEPVAHDPAPPGGATPGNESRPQATPISEPIFAAIARAAGDPAAPPDGPRMEARAA